MTPTLREKLKECNIQYVQGKWMFNEEYDCNDLVDLIESERQAAYEEGAKAMAEECKWEFSVEFKGQLERTSHEHIENALADVLGKEGK